jgi:hypothetical protein
MKNRSWIPTSLLREINVFSSKEGLRVAFGYDRDFIPEPKTMKLYFSRFCWVQNVIASRLKGE